MMPRIFTIIVWLLVLLAGCDDGGSDDGEATAWAETFPAVAEVGWLLSTHGAPGGTRYAVGGTPDEGRILVDDGTGWQVLDPTTYGTPPLLNWVFALADDDVYAVGKGGTVLHFDGASWTREQTPTDQELWGVWGASSADLWAVGGDGREPGQATVLRKQAGGGWVEVELPVLGRPNVFAFFKVWGSSAQDVYIVGQRGGVLHWNGTALEELDLGTSEDLISVWGTGPDRIAAVGGRNNGILARWDGAAWRLESLAPMPGLNGVWMRDPDRIHVAGKRGTLSVIDFDTLERADAPRLTMLDLHALWADADGAATTVGGNLDFLAGPWQGALFERRLAPDE